MSPFEDAYPEGVIGEVPALSPADKWAESNVELLKHCKALEEELNMLRASKPLVLLREILRVFEDCDNEVRPNYGYFIKKIRALGVK